MMTTEPTNAELYRRLAAWERDGKPVLGKLRDTNQHYLQGGLGHWSWRNPPVPPGYYVVASMPTLLVALREAVYHQFFLDWEDGVAYVTLVPEGHDFWDDDGTCPDSSAHGLAHDPDPERALLLAANRVREASV